MSPGAEDSREPRIADVLARLDREQAARRDDFHRSVAERRRAAERFEKLKTEVLHPVFFELERELARRRHTAKLREGRDEVVLTVSVHEVSPRSGSLSVRRSDDALDRVVLELEGVAALRKRYTVDLDAVDRALVTRAVLRLVEGLLGGG
jgi:hypothetical protein